MKRTVVAACGSENLRKLLTSVLESNGYSLIFAAGGKESVAYSASHVPDLLMVNTDLEDGIYAIKSLRAWSNLPIIAISESDREADKIEALDLGADDYITIPFGSGELLARIRAILRRNRLSFDEEIKRVRKYSCKDLDIDFDKYRVSLRGDRVHLTANEFKIIELLAKYSGKVLTYDYILREIWGPYAREDNKTLRVNMANLRRKLEKDTSHPEYLFTEPGIGYRIKESD